MARPPAGSLLVAMAVLCRWPHVACVRSHHHQLHVALRTAIFNHFSQHHLREHTLRTFLCLSDLELCLITATKQTLAPTGCPKWVNGLEVWVCAQHNK